MGNIFIGTTKKSDATMEQVDRNDVYRMLPQIQEALRQGGFGRDCMLLFAEGEDNGQEIDWSTDGSSDPIPLKKLPPAEKKAILGQLRVMLENIGKYVAKLRASSKNNDKSYANIIEKALSFPGPKISDYIYVVDGHPVMMGWGFREGDNSLVDGVQDLIRSVEKSIDENNVEPIKKEVKPAEVEPEIIESPKIDSPKEKEEFIKPEKKPESEQIQEEPGNAKEPEKSVAPDVKPVQETIRPENKVEDKKNEASKVEKKGCGKLIWLLLLLLLLAILAWFLFGREEDPLASLKGQYVSTGILRNLQGQPVDLLLSFPGTDGKGSFMLSTPDQECTAAVQARAGSGETVFINMQEAACPNGDSYENVSLNCNSKTMSCTATAANGENWDITLTRKD